MDRIGLVRPRYHVDGMISPVICGFCGRVYDLTTAEVKQRYADATTFITPCCGKHGDDRQFVSTPSFRPLTPQDGKLNAQSVGLLSS